MYCELNIWNGYSTKQLPSLLVSSRVQNDATELLLSRLFFFESLQLSMMNKETNGVNWGELHTEKYPGLVAGSPTNVFRLLYPAGLWSMIITHLIV